MIACYATYQLVQNIISQRTAIRCQHHHQTLPSNTTAEMDIPPDNRPSPEWAAAVDEKLNQLKRKDADVLLALLRNDTLETSMESMRQACEAHKVTIQMRRIEPIFQAIQGFSSAIGVMVQASPEVAGLLWGSSQMVILVCCNLISVSSCPFLTRITRFRALCASQASSTRSHSCSKESQWHYRDLSNISTSIQLNASEKH